MKTLITKENQIKDKYTSIFKDLRISTGLNQREFTEEIVKSGIKTKYDPQNISNMERNKMPIPFSFLSKIALHFGYNIKIELVKTECK